MTSREITLKLGVASEPLVRAYRKQMGRRATIPWATLQPARHAVWSREAAAAQWAARAEAAHHTSARAAHLLASLLQLGAPLELVGALTRMVSDACRHTELCAKLSVMLGREPLIFTVACLEPLEDWGAIVIEVLVLGGIARAIAMRTMEALHVVSTEPVPEQLALQLGEDDDAHAQLAWETLRWSLERLDAPSLLAVQRALPSLLAAVELRCGGGPELLDALAGLEVDIAPGEVENLGVLSQQQRALIFYDALSERLLPALDALGLNASAAWRRRPHQVAPERVSALGCIAAVAVS